MVEDADYSDIENLEQNLDEIDEKIECSDIYVVQNLFIPIMLVSETMHTEFYYRCLYRQIRCFR